MPPIPDFIYDIATVTKTDGEWYPVGRIKISRWMFNEIWRRCPELLEQYPDWAEELDH